MRRILFVANGHGENAIAARVAVDVARRDPSAVLDLLPLVGTGAGAAPLTLVGPRATMPSGGLVAMGNVRAFIGDLRAGFARLFATQLRFVYDARVDYDTVVAVGDVYALLVGLLARRPIVFVGTAKSAYVAPYGPFERRVMGRADRIFVRDVPTAVMLRARRVAALAPGNTIVDLAGSDPPPTPGERWLGLLPGSRAAAYRDGMRLVRIVRAIAPGRLPPGGARVSIAPTLDIERFAELMRADGWAIVRRAERDAPFEATLEGRTISAWRGSLGPFLAGAVAVLGQAGTANEEAAARGIPVIALADGENRVANWYRMRQHRLLGEALALIPPETAEAAAALAALLADPVRLARMRAAGRARMGPPGGSATIAAEILAVGA